MLGGKYSKYDESSIRSVDYSTLHVETCVLLVRERYTDAEKVSVKVDMDGVKFK